MVEEPLETRSEVEDEIHPPLETSWALRLSCDLHLQGFPLVALQNSVSV